MDSMNLGGNGKIEGRSGEIEQKGTSKYVALNPALLSALIPSPSLEEGKDYVTLTSFGNTVAQCLLDQNLENSQGPSSDT